MPSRLHQWLSSLPVLALYAATVLLETPVIFARWLLALALAALVLLVLHHSVAWRGQSRATGADPDRVVARCPHHTIWGRMVVAAESRGTRTIRA